MSRARWWLIGGATGLVVVAGGLWLWQSTALSSTPEHAALDYLHALESGDPDAVAATGMKVSTSALDAFDAATALIEEARVTSVREDADGASAAVDIEFVLGDAAQGGQLRLGVVDGRWSVDATGLGTVTVDSSIGSEVAIGDATMPVGKSIPLLPAIYTVAAAPATLLDGDSSVSVLPGGKTAATVDAAVRPEATAAAQDQLDDHLETCTAPATAEAEGCGIRIPWGTEFREVSGIRYRIDASPTITLTPTGFTAEGGALVATVTGTGVNGESRTTTYRTDSWTLRGDISFTADGLVLSPW
ncbi:hypothetical protein [Microbacterium sp. NPDC091662]|uniref:hypothetical protein n=1 Tax=Microbacterium sp. NPDC091662 TaxID=3364211 RepID=UPI00381D8969